MGQVGDGRFVKAIWVYGYMGICYGDEEKAKEKRHSRAFIDVRYGFSLNSERDLETSWSKRLDKDTRRKALVKKRSNFKLSENWRNGARKRDGRLYTDESNKAKT